MFMKRKTHVQTMTGFRSGLKSAHAPATEQSKFTGTKTVRGHRKASSIAAGEKPKRIQPNVTSQNRGFIGEIRMLARCLQNPSNTDKMNQAAHPAE